MVLLIILYTYMYMYVFQCMSNIIPRIYIILQVTYINVHVQVRDVYYPILPYMYICLVDAHT